MIIEKLKNWQLSGCWPHTPMLNNSMETGRKLSGVTRWMDAEVPGSVYTDLLRAHYIEDPLYGMNSLKCEWVANRWWIYRTEFSVDPSLRGKRLRLVFKGVDYRAHFYFNNKKVAYHENMYTPCVIDITDSVCFDAPNLLQVVLENAPDEMGQIGYTSRTYTQKARFSYQWDWCTRIVNLGLWDDVTLEADSGTQIAETSWTYRDGLVTARVRTDGEGEVSAVLSFGGSTVTEAAAFPDGDGWTELMLPVDNPQLWYPNGYGFQPLYHLQFTVRRDGVLSDQKQIRIGLRTLSYEQCENADPSSLPYIVRVNGRRIYLKGVNLSPLDHFYGCVGRERYERTLKLVRDAHVTLVRVWGGGLIEKEAFYDVCDEYGIMVWQEFIQSSSGIDNKPSELPEFLENAAATAEHAVRTRRNHVSLTFWSGGNELLEADWTPCTFENKNIAMLRAITDRLDPERLMLPTSPSGPLFNLDNSRPKDCHDVHGPWKYDGVKGQYELYNHSHSQLHSEFGNDGMSNLDAIKTVLPPNDLRVDTVRSNMQFSHRGDWWDTYEYRDKPLFGPMEDLELFIKVSQFMQAEGLRYALEANRRRSWENCGSIVWQFNEPWPNVSCTCLSDYYDHPKFAYYLYRDAMEAFHVSMRYDKLTYAQGETFHASVWVHDDDESADCAVTVRILGDDLQELQRFEAAGRTRAEYAEQLLEFDWTMTGIRRAFYVECSAVSGRRRSDNLYMMLIQDNETPYADTASVLTFYRRYQELKAGK